MVTSGIAIDPEEVERSPFERWGHPLLPKAEYAPPVPDRCSDEEAAAPTAYNHVKDLHLSKEEWNRICDVLEKYPFAPHNPDPNPRLIQLPPVPALARTTKQPYFYGWPITREWLENFAECFNTSGMGLCDWGEAMQRLMRLSRYRHMTLEPVVHGNAPVWEGDDPPKNIKEFDLISVCSTRSPRDYFERRATEVQYAWLEKILPGEPGWYRSTLTWMSWVEIDARAGDFSVLFSWGV